MRCTVVLLTSVVTAACDSLDQQRFTIPEITNNSTRLTSDNSPAAVRHADNSRTLICSPAFSYEFMRRLRLNTFSSEDAYKFQTKNGQNLGLLRHHVVILFKNISQGCVQ